MFDHPSKVPLVGVEESHVATARPTAVKAENDEMRSPINPSVLVTPGCNTSAEEGAKSSNIQSQQEICDEDAPPRLQGPVPYFPNLTSDGEEEGTVDSPSAALQDREHAASIYASNLSNADFSSFISYLLPPTKGGVEQTSYPLDPETMEYKHITLSLIASGMADGRGEISENWSEPPLADLAIPNPSDPVEDSMKTLLQDEIDPDLLRPEFKEQERRKLEVKQEEERCKLAVGSYLCTDVLLGRGGESNHNPGNKAYREEVELLKPIYDRCSILFDSSKETKAFKTRFSKFIAAYNKSQGRRFMKESAMPHESSKPKEKKKCPTRKYWEEASDNEARRKCSQALREKKKACQEKTVQITGKGDKNKLDTTAKSNKNSDGAKASEEKPSKKPRRIIGV